MPFVCPYVRLSVRLSASLSLRLASSVDDDGRQQFFLSAKLLYFSLYVRLTVLLSVYMSVCLCPPLLMMMVGNSFFS